MDSNELKDIISASHSYINDLKVLRENLQVAENQVQSSGDESLKNIDDAFSDLKDALMKTIDKRVAELRKYITKSQTDSLKPLHACQEVITEKIWKAEELIRQSKTVLENASLKNPEHVLQLQSNVLGNLPAVPTLSEVPFLNFIYTEKMKQDILDLCKNFGYIFYNAPVQITSLVEKPGGILIKWEENDTADEKLNSIVEYRLQYANGTLTQASTYQIFHDCYTGTNTEFLKKDLRLNENYTFRVCCRMEGLLEWSPWSINQVGRTTIKPFCWRINESFTLNNENTLATKLTKKYAMLYSDGPQLAPGYSIEFTILDVDEDEKTSMCNAIGLCDETNFPPSDATSAFTVLLGGEILIDGDQKHTKLPSVKKGNKISFTCENTQSDKIRLNVETQDKNVTYDWVINDSKKLYFFIRCVSEQLKILVE